MASDVGVPLSILESVQHVNERQRQLLCERLVARLGEDLHGHVIGLWGLAFKPGTDDLREAPSLALIDGLLQRGAVVRAFDPVAMPGLQRAGLPAPDSNWWTARWRRHPVRRHCWW